MPGQAVITVDDKQWSVDVASTYTELITGLSGLPSMPAGTGMLFDLGYDQSYIEIDMSQMLFPLDIIFINSTQGVVAVIRNAQPGAEVYFEATTTPGARYFLEVNAGEADGVGAGDSVSITGYQPVAFDLTTVISFAMPLVALGFVCSLAGGMMTGVTGSSSSPKRGERPQVKKVTVECPICKKMIEVGEYDSVTRSEALKRHIEAEHHQVGGKAPYIHETRRIGDKVIKKYSVAGTEVVVYEAWELSAVMGKHSTITSIDGQWYGRVGTRYLPGEIEKLPPGPERSKAVGKWHEDQYQEAYALILKAFPEAEAGRRSMGEITLHWAKGSEHHSMWLTTEQRKGLEEKYGAVAVRWAEEAARPGDIKAVEVAAEYFYKKLREALGLGHLSPELSEEQIRKLREVLGLPKEVPPREKGYID